MKKFLLFFFFVFTQCYLPGVAPKEYTFGETIGVKVNSLTSTKTQMPFEYYKLPLCKPPKVFETAENLGEILIGDRIENSPYEVKVGVEEKCKLLCRQTMTVQEAALVAERIEEEYRVHWLVDNLPAATKRMTMDSSGKPTTVLEDGFMLGKRGKDINGGDPEKVYLHNHVKITILFNQDDEGKYRIVGVEVEPQSIAYDPQSTELNCQRTAATLPQPVGEKDISPTITFTYSISWESRSDIKWASRWDIYLLMTDDQIHWFSIINSLIIVFFLTGMVAMIMMRTLHADLRRYRESENQEEAQEETGWKLVHGDVFRPPSYPLLLSSLVGSGAQVFGMCVVTMLFAVLGFLSPANRGGLMTAMIVLFVVMGAFGGYFSARLYKLFKGQNWKQSTLTTAFLFPGAIFLIFMVLDVILAFQGSSGAVPFGTLVALVALWFGISVPLVFLGSYFGHKKDADEMPVRTNAIPRQIPEQVWYMRPIFSILMGGILPFGAVFIELFFILSSIWLHQFYYLFGFLAIVFIILILTCAEITIVMCYFQLCSEDYHWWWRSFLTSGASAFFMFLYSVFYFFTKLQISQIAPIIVYFGYTTIMALGFFLLTGSIGFYACYYFVVKIYGAIKLE